MNQQDIDLLEQQRKAILPWYIISIALLVVALPLFSAQPILGVICILVAVILFAFVAGTKAKEYDHMYKMLMVEKPMKEAFADCVYMPKQGLEKNLIVSTNLIDMGDNYHSEDYIRGHYRGVLFERADVKITETHTDGDGHSRTVTLFQGRWMIFDFNKNFRTEIQVIQDGFSSSKTRSGIFTSKAVRRERVEFEDEYFNRAFRCFAQDQHEAFYVLTPQMLKAIRDIATLMDGRIMLGFIHNKLHVAVANGKDTLEPSVFRKISYQRDTAEVKKKFTPLRPSLTRWIWTKTSTNNTPHAFVQKRSSLCQLLSQLLLSLLS